MKIYVAGGMREVKAVAFWMEKLRAEKFEVTHDWTAVEQAAETDEGLPAIEAIKCSRAALKGVADAGVIWHVVSQSEGSRGAYFEMGYAHAMHKTVYVSGPWRKTIFHHLAARKFEGHADAFDALVGYRRSSS